MALSRISKLSFVAGLILILASCVNHEKEEPLPLSECAVSPAKYTTDVQPIIQQNCATTGCHVAGFPDGDFTTYADLKEKVDNGSFKNSVLDAHAPIMPPTGALPDAQLRILSCWIENGALNN